MAKVTRVGGRGTSKRKTDTTKKSSFSGDSYREYQEKRKNWLVKEQYLLVEELEEEN